MEDPWLSGGDKAARALQARAFGWGEHLAFASGEYDPASPVGRGPLAHELAHVLQQRGGGMQMMPANVLQAGLTAHVPGPDADKVYVAAPRRLSLAAAGGNVIVGSPRGGEPRQVPLREHGIGAASTVGVDGVEIEPGIGLVVTGRVEPTIEMLRRATLDFQIRGTELVVSKTFGGSDLALGGPFRIDGSALTLAIGTASGLMVDGGVAFSIQRLGQATRRGSGRSDGFRVAGQFDFDRTMFDVGASIPWHTSARRRRATASSAAAAPSSAAARVSATGPASAAGRSRVRSSRPRAAGASLQSAAPRARSQASRRRWPRATTTAW